MKGCRGVRMVLVVGVGWALAACQAPFATSEATTLARSVTPTASAPSSTPNTGPVATTEPTPAEPPTLTPELPTPAAAPLVHLPRGQTLTLEQITMLGPSAGWAIGASRDEVARVLRTGDGGLTWTDVTPPEAPPSAESGRRVLGEYADEQRAWVVFSGGTADQGSAPAVVWRTADGGRSWLPSRLVGPPFGAPWFEPLALGVREDGFGWLMMSVGAGMSHQYVALYTSQDQGITWDRILDPTTDQPVQSCPKTGLEFADALHGWMARDCGGLIDQVTIEMTDDGGTTWESKPVPAPDALQSGFTYPYMCTPHSIRLTSASLGSFAVSCRRFLETPGPGGETLADGPHALYRTQDGGATWDVREYPGGEVLWLDAARGWALGRSVYRTENGSASWSLVHQVNWDGQFTFVDTQNGWAVARDGEEVALVRTRNGGSSWAILKPVTGP